MVVVGIWPYQHTMTLRLIGSQGKAVPIYYVDEDRILTLAEAQRLADQDHILDQTYMTLMSPEIEAYVAPYKEQAFPPPIPSTLKVHIQSHEPKELSKMIDAVAEHAPIAIVGDQSSSLMQDLGARYNPSLGLWFLDATHLKILRDKRRQKYDGKVQMKQHTGGTLVEIYGDVSAHIQRIKDARGIYDEARDVWLVPISTVNQIYDIFST